MAKLRWIGGPTVSKQAQAAVEVAHEHRRAEVDPRLDPVARCLAKMDGEFISGVEWVGDRGESYRDAAREVLRTIDNVEAGNYTGGCTVA